MRSIWDDVTSLQKNGEGTEGKIMKGWMFTVILKFCDVNVSIPVYEKKLEFGNKFFLKVNSSLLINMSN